MSAAEVKSRAAVGSVLFAGRSALIQFVGLAANIVVARLLTPSDFGVVALGFTLVSVGRLLTDTGIGMALVRRKEVPTRTELQAITGYQLLVSLTLCAVAFPISFSIGRSGLITAVMLVSLPILAFRTAGILYLDRTLDFRIRVRVEVGESLLYSTWICATALLGWGAWSIATALLAQSALGATLVILLAPTGFVRPRLRLNVLKPFLSFGLRFQSYTLVTVANDVILVAGISSVGGLHALGLWSFSGRVLIIPQTLFAIFLGLGTPTYARLLQAGEHLGEAVMRSSTVLGVLGGFFLAPLAGCGAALMPIVFGAKWSPVAMILPGSCFALTLAGPLSICIIDAMFAAGDAKTPLRAAMISAPARIVIALVGLRYFGVFWLGAAWFVAQLVALPIVLPRAHRLLGAPVGRSLIAPALAFTISAGTGWALVHELTGATVIGVIGGSLTSASIFVLTLAGAGRSSLNTTVSTLRVVLRETRSADLSG